MIVPRALIELLLAIPRQVDALITAGSIENARSAVAERRRALELRDPIEQRRTASLHRSA